MLQLDTATDCGYGVADTQFFMPFEEIAEL
jgi:hypothetical protein